MDYSSSSHRQRQPFVLLSMQCSYDELLASIERLPVCRKDGKSLPVEIIQDIADFLTVYAVVPSEVRVTKASSTSNHFPLTAALDPSTRNWWTSRFGTMPFGRGRESVTCTLSDRLCRLSTFSIQIPPIPSGPLSVRDFQLEASSSQHRSEDNGGEEWRPISPIWMAENVVGWQVFRLDPPVDARQVRVVCMNNQMANLVPRDHPSLAQLSAVGFYAVKFE